jgi:hypothetical protein
MLCAEPKTALWVHRVVRHNVKSFHILVFSSEKYHARHNDEKNHNHVQERRGKENPHQDFCASYEVPVFLRDRYTHGIFRDTILVFSKQ